MFMTILRLLPIPVVIIAMIAGASSCTSQAGSEPGANAAAASGIGLAAPNVIRLHGASRSADELVTAALAAFQAGDTAALQRMMISREEYDRYIYPELKEHFPAARDTSAPVREFIRENHMLSADKALRKSLRQLGGRHMELVSVTFSEGVKSFPTYAIHEGTEVKVRLENGDEADLRSLGAMVEMDGVYKLLSYRDRE